jgi:hypothetical protein
MYIIGSIVIGLLLSTSISAMKDVQDQKVITALFNQMLKDYRPTKERARSLCVNRDSTIDPEEQRDAIDIELACLLAGSKDVQSCQQIDFLQADPLLLYLLCHKKACVLPLYYVPYALFREVQENIIFFPHNQRKALLLAKYTLTDQLAAYTDIKCRSDRYLMGILYGYRPEDCEFYELVCAFIKHYEDLVEEYQVKMKDVVHWPVALKERLAQFEQNMWPNTNDYFRLQEAKLVSAQWLRENELYSNEVLMIDICRLQQQLKLYAPPITNELLLKREHNKVFFNT